MDDLWIILFWTGLVGIGLFFSGLGVLLWGLGQFMKNRKGTE